MLKGLRLAALRAAGAPLKKSDSFLTKVLHEEKYIDLIDTLGVKKAVKDHKENPKLSLNVIR